MNPALSPAPQGGAHTFEHLSWSFLSLPLVWGPAVAPPYAPGTLGLISTQSSRNVIARLTSKNVVVSRLLPLASMAFHLWNPMTLVTRMLLICSFQVTQIVFMDRGPIPKISAQGHSTQGKSCWEGRVNIRINVKSSCQNRKQFKHFLEKKRNKRCIDFCLHMHDCFFGLVLLLKSYLYAINLVSRVIISLKTSFLKCFTRTPVSQEQGILG